MDKITIQELLYNRGLDKNSRIKLVRHKDTQSDLYEIYKTDKQKFLKYQEEQYNDVFNGVDFIVSFIGEKGRLARFIGVFEILGCEKLPNIEKSVNGGEFQFKYKTAEVAGFEALKERVIVDWGKSAISWNQWMKNDKEVVEIQPGLHYQQFTDYFDFILDFQELKEIIQNKYKDWERMLSATKGVYLISDTQTGKLYVGSAYGENGIWGRWSEYVSTNGHGGNEQLKELIFANENYANNFRFSLLMLLPKTITDKQARAKEQLFKRKLGTNSFGLNSN